MSMRASVGRVVGGIVITTVSEQARADHIRARVNVTQVDQRLHATTTLTLTLALTLTLSGTRASRTSRWVLTLAAGRTAHHLIRIRRLLGRTGSVEQKSRLDHGIGIGELEERALWHGWSKVW